MSLSSLVILGSGYTGRYVYRAAIASGARAWATSRHPEANLPYVSPADRLTFDLAQPVTWSGIPPACRVIWCFPAQPLALVRQFAAAHLTNVDRLIVLGSTSAYRRHETPARSMPPWIDEGSPVDESLPRVQGEEYLRKHCGAVVLRTAGIYGPGRNPLDWIRGRRVGYSSRYVNLIHVEDLASICLQSCERGVPGEVYNVSDGVPRTWEEICRQARDRWGLSPLTGSANDGPGKRIGIGKLQRQLGYRFQHPDLYQALALLEPPPARP